MDRKLPHLALTALLLVSTGLLADESDANDLQGHERRIQSLQNSSVEIEKRLAELQPELERLGRLSAPERSTRDLAEQRYEEAKQALQDVPSVANRERMEAAKFEFFIAERKYQRAARDIGQLEAKRAELRQSLAGNERAIASAYQQIEETKQAAARREQEALQAAASKALAERNLRRKKQRQLDQTQAEHAEAMAEIAKLKAQLARQKVAALPRPPAPTPATAAVAPPARDPSPRSAAPPRRRADNTPRATLVRNGRDTYLTLLRASRNDDGGGRRMQKILQVSTLEGSRVTRQTSHSLKYLGNNLYEGRSVIRAGNTQFEIGEHRWKQHIPGSEDRSPYVFMLDQREDKPQLLLFSRNDLGIR